MPGFFSGMGVIQWPMYVATIFMLIQIGRAALQLRQPPETRSAMTRHTILVWGFLNALLGVLGTALGLTLAGRIVAQAEQVSPHLLAGGITVALSSTVFGLLLLTIAVVAWLVLQVWQGGSPRDGMSAASGRA